MLDQRIRLDLYSPQEIKVFETKEHPIYGRVQLLNPNKTLINILLDKQNEKDYTSINSFISNS